MPDLNPKQAAFVAEFLVDLNATQAAIRAGYSAKAARQIGAENLGKPEIAAAIREAMQARSERLEITHDQVLRELWAIATADTNELVEHAVGCCRHCHGQGHRYQFTLIEYERAELAHEANRTVILAGRDGRDIGPFDPQGGIGFNATLPPVADCPECFGQGASRPIFKDTAKASPAARALYAGFKLTKEGMEMKLHSKADALDKIAKHIGFFAPVKHEHEVSGEVEHKFAGQIDAAVTAALEAARKAEA